MDAAGQVLIAQRPPGKHLAGGWEFPGGKLEPGEERLAGLARELREELGITIRKPRPLIRVRHTYPYGDVLLDVWVIRHYSGEPRGLDGQALRWCTQEELATVDLLPADAPLVRALRLPERLTQVSSRDYTVGDARSLGDRAGGEPGAEAPGAEAINGPRLHGVFCANTDAAVGAAKAGSEFLVMRHALGDAELVALCDSVPVPVFARGIALQRAWALGASGLNEICR